MFNAAAFFSYIFVSAFTPGPNNFMAMSNASRFGFKGSFRFCLGVFAGICVVMVSCAVFSAALFQLIPKIEPFMRVAGAAYLCRLAWSVYRDKGGCGGGAGSGTSSFFTGAVMQFVNVKLMLYGVTAISAFVLPYNRSPAALAFFAMILSLMGFVGTCCWALFGSAFQKLFAVHAGTLNVVMSLLLLYCAASVLRG